MTDEELVEALANKLKEFNQAFVANTNGPVKVAESLGSVLRSIAYRFSRATDLYIGLNQRLEKAVLALTTKTQQEIEGDKQNPSY
tara:strand:+ start:6206 stop:6460 length:255 start_codon:yes stop_codon:yes gene_type:complete